MQRIYVQTSELACVFAREGQTKVAQEQQRYIPTLNLQHAIMRWCSTTLEILMCGSDGAIIAPQILHIKPGRLSIITGTLYKDMKLKPDVLKEYAKEVHLLSIGIGLIRYC